MADNRLYDGDHLDIWQHSGARGSGGGMTTPKINALGIVQDGSPTRWKATGYVEGMGWLEAWGKSLIKAPAATTPIGIHPLGERP